MFAQDWPCWLSCVLATNTPLRAAYVNTKVQELFPLSAHWLPLLKEFSALWDVPPEWKDCVILGSGSHKYLSFVLTKLRSHVGPFLYANNCVFKGRQRRNIDRLYRSWAAWDVLHNLNLAIVVHAKFGGVTSASQLISYWRVNAAVFTPVCSLP